MAPAAAATNRTCFSTLRFKDRVPLRNISYTPFSKLEIQRKLDLAGTGLRGATLPFDGNFRGSATDCSPFVENLPFSTKCNFGVCSSYGFTAVASLVAVSGP
jgi:hypothetical protein